MSKTAVLTRELVAGVVVAGDMVAGDTTPQFAVSEQSQTDEQLLQAYKTTGDRETFATLVGRYEIELYNYLRRYLNDAALAEDAFQMTFMQVHSKCEQFDGSRSFRPWLYTIATHQAIDVQRKAKREPSSKTFRLENRFNRDDMKNWSVEQAASSAPSPDAVYESQAHAEWVRGAVAQLPEVYRTALVMVYYQGMQYQDVAATLGVPTGTAKSRVHSAITKLSAAWKRTHGCDD